MEELRQTSGIVFATDGIQEQPGGLHKAGRRRIVPRQTKAPETLSKGSDALKITEAVFGISGDQIHILAEIGHLEAKGGIVGQDTGGIIMKLQPVSGIFQREGGLFVRNMPVEWRQGQLAAERDIYQMGGVDEPARVLHGAALSEDPVDQLKRGDIGPAGILILRIPGVVRKIQGGHTEPLFVACFCIERISVHDCSHADDGIMPSQHTGTPEGDGIVSGGDDHGCMKFIVQIHGASEIKVVGLHSNAGAHEHSPYSFFIKSSLIVYSPNIKLYV